jgi:hypothetical protein
MAKKAKVTSDVNMDTLNAIKAAMDSNTVYYISQTDGLPLLNHNPPLIEVNTSMVQSDGKAACRLTTEGVKMVNNTQAEAPASNPYEITSGVVLAPRKRGNFKGGAPTQYPFDKLEIGQGFFVPVSTKHKNPVKTLGSTVSSANMRYAQKTGETKQVERAVRDKQTKKAIKNGNGEVVRETVTVPIYKLTRKFMIGPVEKGKNYGTFVAPDNGAYIMRVELPQE